MGIGEQVPDSDNLVVEPGVISKQLLPLVVDILGLFLVELLEGDHIFVVLLVVLVDVVGELGNVLLQVLHLLGTLAPLHI